MNTIDKITRAKIAVIYDSPFFATLLMRKQFVPDKGVETMVTNGQTIRFNEQWVEGLSRDELKGVICKSAMHTAMLHHLRRGGRDAQIWKQACDYAVAPILQSSGLQLPSDLIDPRFADMSAENIFTELTKKPKDDEDGDDKGNQPGNQPGQDPGGSGTVEDAPSDTDTQLAEAEAKQELAQAIMVGKQAGKMPGGMDVIMEILEAHVPWQEIIARFLTEPARNDYSFSRPNRRYLHTGIMMPSLFSLEVGEIVLAADTSISMDEDKLNRVATEMHEVATSFQAHLTAIYCDTEVQHVQEVEPYDEFIPEPKGGGGTDFRPPFEWLEEHGITPKSLIYFTDGECWDFPDHEPDYPVLWAISGGRKFEPPFGEVVYID